MKIFSIIFLAQPSLPRAHMKTKEVNQLSALAGDFLSHGDLFRDDIIEICFIFIKFNSSDGKTHEEELAKRVVLSNEDVVQDRFAIDKINCRAQFQLKMKRELASDRSIKVVFRMRFKTSLIYRALHI